MYIPEQFREARLNVLRDLIRSCPLATLIVSHDGELIVNHLPLMLKPDDGNILQGHIPRSNRLCDALAHCDEATAIFHGPQAYISPSWYPSKQADGRVVPTWNYAVVHARGRPSVIHDSTWLRSQLDDLTAQMESARPEPWQVSDAPAAFTEKLVGTLVGIKLDIESLEGKWKVSQNRSEADRAGVVRGLRSTGDSSSAAMADLIRTSGNQEPG